MSIVITDETLHKIKMSEEEFIQEIALLFYQQKRLTLAQASAMAGKDRLTFQHMLANRDIPIHYDEYDLATDVKTLHATSLFGV